MQIELTKDQEASIIPAAVYFLRALTTSLGSEAGLHVWDQINATIGNDIKGKVFFAMLTGKIGAEIILRGHRHSQTSANLAFDQLPLKIEIIKAIRAVSGQGLYDAKQVADALLAGQEQRIQSESFELRDLNVKKLWAVGIDAI
mgnify:CR=1 FL=1